MLARPAAPPAAVRRNCRRPGQRGLVTLDFAIWFPPCVARAELPLARRPARGLLARLFDCSGSQAGNVIVEEEHVSDHDRQRADAGPRHQRTPVVDVATEVGRHFSHHWIVRHTLTFPTRPNRRDVLTADTAELLRQPRLSEAV